MTDSKSAASWLNDVVTNSYRVRTKGLQEVVVQRRLHIVSGIVIVAGLSVTVVWVPSAKNRANILTRGQAQLKESSIAASLVEGPSGGPVQQHDIAAAQRTDALIAEVISQIEEGRPLHALFTKVGSQLVIVNGLLCHSVKLPIDGVMELPVMASKLVPEIVSAAHTSAGHGSWNTMFDVVRSCSYFPHMAAQCQRHVQQCVLCKAATSRRKQALQGARGQRWS